MAVFFTVQFPYRAPGHVGMSRLRTALAVWRTRVNLQVRLKALGRHGVGQDDIAQAVVQLPGRELAVLLQRRIQQRLHLRQAAALIHLHTACNLASAPSTIGCSAAAVQQRLFFRNPLRFTEITLKHIMPRSAGSYTYDTQCLQPCRDAVLLQLPFQ